MQIGDIEFTRCPVPSIGPAELEVVDRWRRRPVSGFTEAELLLDARLAEAFEALDVMGADGA